MANPHARYLVTSDEMRRMVNVREAPSTGLLPTMDRGKAIHALRMMLAKGYQEDAGTLALFPEVFGGAADDGAVVTIEAAEPASMESQLLSWSLEDERMTIRHASERLDQISKLKKIMAGD